MIEDLQWRYATKKMNEADVPKEKLDTILESIRLSASSYGLQPFTVVVVKNKEIRLRLKAAAYGQDQLDTSSEVLVFCVPTSITENMIDDYIQLVANTRGLDISDLAGLKQMMTGSILGLSAEQQQQWAAKQAYIALGTALATAAQEKVDACPMEGFDAAQFGEILELGNHNLKAVVIMPIGYRSPEDDTANHKKVRKTPESLFVHK